MKLFTTAFLSADILTPVLEVQQVVVVRTERPVNCTIVDHLYMHSTVVPGTDTGTLYWCHWSKYEYQYKYHYRYPYL